ncbi:hypothetical protein DNX69_20355 [Rhodopseudomonas palustris]|uniref:Uncharacterized protein n=1 Tax=Rhodopseudomonas palustris TaxID=1076 RepID=A0A323UD01_RHOPL|nr:hypothetical protein [Rhodopseudomonas palustris]PZA10169.1 hypothetical protein DNX69_20355 [Rhodopseudomonas palustris]
MTRHALLITAAIVLIPDLSHAQPRALDWQRYNVAAGSAAADVPRAIFSEDGGPAQDGPGRRFVSADGRADLTVQAVPNPDGVSPAAFLAARKPPSGIIYRRVTPRFFAVSSVRNGRIWYNRCNRGRAVMNCVLINYPATEKRKWDAIVTRISRSLSGP